MERDADLLRSHHLGHDSAGVVVLFAEAIGQRQQCCRNNGELHVEWS